MEETLRQTDYCGECKSEVEDEHLAMYCEYCTKLLHIKCENINEEKYELLKELKEERIH